MKGTAELVGRNGLSKVTRYGWQLRDQPGVMMMIPKARLRVDHSYQRDVREKSGKVVRMAANWSWVGCGVLIVSHRDGVMWVIDGQHRKLAADRRHDITELPCLVFDGLDGEQEASSFLVANTERRPMTSMERFRALLRTRDPLALQVASLVDAAGRRICNDTDRNTVKCVGAMMECLKLDAPAFHRAWPVILEVSQGTSVYRDVVEALFYLEYKAEDGCGIALEPWRKRIVRIGAQGLLDCFAVSRALHKKSCAKICALGALNAINKGLRTQSFKLEPDWMTEAMAT